jgi:hypothetical protein
MKTAAEEGTDVSFVTAEMADAVGTVLLRLVSHPVSASDIRRWALAVHWPDTPPQRWSASANEASLLAPEEFNPFAWSVRECEPAAAPTIHFDDPQRIEKLAGVAGPTVRFNLHGGIKAEYASPMHVGDVITNVTRLKSYHERVGSLGRMLFTTIEETWSNQRSDLVKRCELTMIRY